MIHHINKWKAQNHMIITIDTEKHLIKFHIYSGLKVVIKVGVEGTYLSIIKTVYDKSTAKIILSGMITLPSKFKNKRRMPALSTSV